MCAFYFQGLFSVGLYFRVIFFMGFLSGAFFPDTFFPFTCLTFACYIPVLHPRFLQIHCSYIVTSQNGRLSTIESRFRDKTALISAALQPKMDRDCGSLDRHKTRISVYIWNFLRDSSRSLARFFRNGQSLHQQC